MAESGASPLELDQAPWLALVIGNTRLHWGRFQGAQLQQVWHTPHLTPAIAAQLLPQLFSAAAWQTVLAALGDSDQFSQPAWAWPPVSQVVPLYVASVVPQQTALWQGYAALQEVQLHHLPLARVYPTLGIDRALNLLAAGQRYGWPVLVIDAGTALTFTAGDQAALLGGAILPGLGLQFQALAAKTAALPLLTLPRGGLPCRWARGTPEAIQSGILYGAMAVVCDFIVDWQRQWPQGAVVITGGDAAQLVMGLQAQGRLPPILHQVSDLSLWGLACYRQHLQTIAPGCETDRLGG